MPTNDRKINIYNKRLLSLTGIKDNFLDFLTDEIDEVIAAIFQGTAGVLDADQIEIVAGASNDRFSLDLSNASRVVVGTGQIIDISQITGTSITSDIYFEDDGSSVYYVGIKFAEVEDGIELNPRTGDPEYPSLKQTFGEVDNPNSVTDNTTYIRLNINNITESGVDHSGRTVRVWLVDPVSGVESTAFFEGTSAYASPNNYVDVPYSGGDGPLGQDTSSNPPSTTASDYKVFIEGASWKKNIDLRNEPNYAFIGTITSTGGVPTFSMTDQVPIFINTLDRAYDGAAGSGSGRKVWVDSGAIWLRTAITAGGGHNAQMRFDRYGNTDWMQFMLVIETGDQSGIPVAVFQSERSPGSTISEVNAVTISGNTLTFTGGGVDLTDTDLRLTKKLHLIYLESATDSDEIGLYVIDTFTATTCNVKALDNSTPSFASTSGSVRVLVPKYIMSHSNPHNDGDVLDWCKGFSHVLRDGEGFATRFRVIPNGAFGSLVEFYDTDFPTSWWARWQIGAPGTTTGIFEFFRRGVFRDTGFDGEHGLLVEGGGGFAAGQGIASLTDPKFTIAAKSYGGGAVADRAQIALNDGALVKAAGWRDDFLYEGWSNAAATPPNYTAHTVGVSADVSVGWCSEGVHLNTDNTNGDIVELRGGRRLYNDTAYGFRWRFAAIVCISTLSDLASMIQIGLRNNLFPSGNYEYYFQRIQAVLGGVWEFKGLDNGVGFAINTGVVMVAGYYYYLYISVERSFVVYYVGRLGYNTLPNAMTQMGSRSHTGGVGALDGEDYCWYPHILLRTDENATKDAYMPYWEWWDGGEAPNWGVASNTPKVPRT